ncbi:hypothetical protein AZH53_00140 [Methanomicrobiaceae archaeon CYW5]|uniref:DUF2238 domain-containing protein n=1 Tax=Methanovulcanius yangii TaxID=1789227 RepID=UPI0029C9DB5D|nr:DUF2238 domain-containing protein [Methanovulcanius yangii]MBT8506839.1 hypothetical protein [Methanovulcanius yangii]
MPPHCLVALWFDIGAWSIEDYAAPVPFTFRGYMTIFLQVMIIFIIIDSMMVGNYSYVFGGFIVLLLTMVPMIMEREVHITVPWWLTFLIVLSLYIHIGGQYFDWYTTLYPYYDKIAHFISGTTVALIGFTLVLLLDQYTENNFNRPVIIFLIVMLTVAVGGLWEIFEYTVDTFLGIEMQHGLDDTMLDMIFVLLGRSSLLPSAISI